jgi:hypothetical protein
MIYNGKKGYISGDLNQPIGTVLAMTKGPIKGRNWNYTATNPTYSITITSGSTGKVKLQGTNDVVIRDNTGGELNPIDTDLLPSDNATWTDIQIATSISVSSSFSTEYQFLRLIIDTQGVDGDYVTQAWVRWT